MDPQQRRESRQSTENDMGLQRVPSEQSESIMEQNTRDSLPKYYPKDHEVTRWLINQMRCRNGLHHLVNLANIQPSLLSAYFEVFDQPHLYIDARTGPGMPAYNIKTVLYLTPLAIAVYFRLRSVLRLLLDTSGSRIHARARQEIDVNATCYVRRTKPRPGPFVMDEYSTTNPAIIAVRREFFAGLNMLMSASFHPQAPIGIRERLGTPQETTHWFVDLLDFCVNFLNTRPGVDVIGLLQTISYRGTADVMTSSSSICYYDPCVYDVRPVKEQTITNQDTWCSVFQRLVRKGASRNYSNCGNRLIGLLEHIVAVGFFRREYMPKGFVEYDAELIRRNQRILRARKMTPEMIRRLSGPEKDAAIMGIAADRDVCLCLLTLWLERVRTRCLERQAQRLFRLLTTVLAETELLYDFLHPPTGMDFNSAIHPHWLAVGLPRLLTKPMVNAMSPSPGDFGDDDMNELYELEPPQLNELRQEIGILSQMMGLVDYPDLPSNTIYPRVEENTTIRGIGDAIAQQRISDAMRYGKTPPTIDRKCKYRCVSEDHGRRVVENQKNVKFGDIATGAPSGIRKVTRSSDRTYWAGTSQNASTSHPVVGCGNKQSVDGQGHDENKNNTTANTMPEPSNPGKNEQSEVVCEENTTPSNGTPNPGQEIPTKTEQLRSGIRNPQTQPSVKRSRAFQPKRPLKQTLKANG